MRGVIARRLVQGSFAQSMPRSIAQLSLQSSSSVRFVERVPAGVSKRFFATETVVKLPALAESLTEGEIGQIHVKVGAGGGFFFFFFFPFFFLSFFCKRCWQVPLTLSVHPPLLSIFVLERLFF